MKTILVLDDDPIIRKSLRGSLSRHSYNVVEASSVPQAISTIRREVVNLAIIDIKMPITKGYDFFWFMRDRKEYAKIPVIILTGVEGAEGEKHAGNIGADAYYTKPYNFDELLATIENLTNQ